jgi:hypothetical protein
MRQILAPPAPVSATSAFRPRVDSNPVLPSASVLAVLGALPPDADVVVVRDGPSWVIGVEPTQIVLGRGEEAFAAVDGLHRGLVGGLSGLRHGAAVEHVTPRIAHDPGLPTWRWPASKPA